MPVVILDQYTNQPDKRVVRTTITGVGRKWIKTAEGYMFDATVVPPKSEGSGYRYLYTEEMFDERQYRESVRKALLEFTSHIINPPIEQVLKLGDAVGIPRPPHLYP